MEQITKIRTMPVSALMARDVVIMEGSRTVAEAIQMMKKRGITYVIVQPRNEDDVHGILTKRDILEKVIDPGEDIYRDPWNTQIHDVMSKPLISIYPEMGVKYAIRLMKRVSVRRLGVMEGRKLVGIIGEIDVLHAVLELPSDSGSVAL